MSLSKSPFSLLASMFLRGVCLVPVLLLYGCGTGEYDSRMEQTISKLRSGTAQSIDQLLHTQATPIPGTSISFRLPTVFDAGAKSMNMTSQENGTAIDANRVQPPFTKLPGFRFSYEKWVQDDTGTELPIFCYIAAVDSSSTTQDAIMDQVQKDLKAAFPATPDSWETVELETADGQKLSCRRVSVVAQQRFDRTSKGGPNRNLEGRFEAYLHSSGSFHVLIAWRAPTRIPQQQRFFQTAEASFASLKQ